MLSDLIYRDFSVGERYSLSSIKNPLKSMYSSCGYESSPKAKDLREWFEIDEVYMTEGGKRVHGYKIIKKKQ